MELNFSLQDFSIALGIFLFFLILRTIFTKLILKLFEVLVKKTKNNFDDNLINIFLEPIRIIFILLGYFLATKYLNFESAINDKIIGSGYIFVIFWMALQIIALFEQPITNFSKRFGQELYKEIGNFIIKILKVFAILVGFVAILQIWGINVSAFIASLGIGGLAFALAAKDTAANLFGGLTILADKTLKIGDWIKVDDVEGIVEDIGLRTTRVRTFEKSLITVPNQLLANQPVENFSKRGIRRIKYRIGLTYNTPADTVQKISDEIRAMLLSHPDISKDALTLVRFDVFDDSSLSIFVYTFTNTADWADYLKIREDINLKIIHIVEDNNSSFAFPTQSIYIENDEKTT